jgi:hypothetical protein
VIGQAACLQCGAANRIARGHKAGAAKCGRCSRSLSLDRVIDRKAGLMRAEELVAWVQEHIRAPAESFSA